MTNEIDPYAELDERADAGECAFTRPLPPKPKDAAMKRIDVGQLIEREMIKKGVW